MKFVSDIINYTNTYEEIEMKEILLPNTEDTDDILYLKEDDDLLDKIVVCYYPNNLYILVKDMAGKYHWADIDESSVTSWEHETKKEAIMEDYQSDTVTGIEIKHYAFDSLGELAKWMTETF